MVDIVDLKQQEAVSQGINAAHDRSFKIVPLQRKQQRIER